MKKHVFPLLMVLFVAGHAVAQSPESVLTFSNGGRGFRITKPAGWLADSTQAKNYDADLVLYRESEGLGKDNPLIRIKAVKWDPTSRNSGQDQSGYKKREDIWKAQGYDSAHKDYTFQTIMLISKDGDEITSIKNINPGPGSPCFFAISLVERRSASSESNGYGLRTVINSFTAL